jgi:hypothetical protein
MTPEKKSSLDPDGRKKYYHCHWQFRQYIALVIHMEANVTKFHCLSIDDIQLNLISPLSLDPMPFAISQKQS